MAIPLGIAIALNRHVADTLRPVLTFLQSIAGIAWVPLAIIWFGIGQGAVVFVIANTIFFAAIYNTVVGVRSIPNTLYRAVRSHGGKGIQIFTELILPGALVRSSSASAPPWPMAGARWSPAR
ncbi:MAG: ABC transporter permease subunit [Geminicoccaceae bacterium]